MGMLIDTSVDMSNKIVNNDPEDTRNLFKIQEDNSLLKPP